MTCCVLILNYNGRAHLETCVPSVLRAAARVDGGCPVVVVDNQSTDDSLAWLGQRHPAVQAIVCEANDCLFSLNKVVASRSEDFVVILNNDIRVDERFVMAMLPHFKDLDFKLQPVPRYHGFAEFHLVHAHEEREFVFKLRLAQKEDRAGLSLRGRLKAFFHGGKQAYTPNSDQCHACGLCVSACPEKAITLVPVR